MGLFDDLEPKGQQTAGTEGGSGLLNDLEPKKSGLVRRGLGDTGISLLKGAIAVPETAVGLADIATGGAAGKAAEGLGFRPKEAKQILDSYLSPEQQAANRNVAQADGFVDTAKAIADNPSVIPHTVAESLPPMLAGGVAGRGISAVAPKLAPWAAGAAGEGTVMAGSAAENIRQQTPDGLLTPEQQLAAAGTGLIGGAVGAGGAKIGQKLGLGDLDTALVEGAKNAGARGLPARLAGGAAVEGALQEMPQSVAEQGLQNYALGKPLGEGVGNAAATGLVTGGAMGAGFGALPAATSKAEDSVQPAPSVENPSPAPVPRSNPNNGPLSRAANLLPIPAPVLDTQRIDQAAGLTAPPLLDAARIAQQVDLNTSQPDWSGKAPAVDSQKVGQQLFAKAGSPVDWQSAPPVLDTGKLGQPAAQPQGQPAATADGAPAPAAAAPSQPATMAPDDSEARTIKARYLSRQGAERARAKLDAADEYKVVQDGNVWRVTGKTAAELLDQPVPADTASSAEALRRQEAEARQAAKAARLNGDNAEGRRQRSLELQARAQRQQLEGQAVTDGQQQRLDAAASRVQEDQQAQQEQALRDQLAYVENQARASGGWNTHLSKERARLRQALEPFEAAKAPQSSTEPQPATDQMSVKDAAPATAGVKAETLAADQEPVKQPEQQASTTSELEQPVSQPAPSSAEGADSRSAEIDSAAHEAATSPHNDLPEPSHAQIEAGNYKKGHVRVQGLDISIENPRGSERRGMRQDGTEWRHTMSDHYGYIKRSVGSDNEQVDVYVGPQPESDRVFVVDQLHQQDGSFDEHKVMLGYPDEASAVAAYRSNFDPDWKVGPVASLSVQQFKDWLDGGDLSKPATSSEVRPTDQQPATKAAPLGTVEKAPSKPKARGVLAKKAEAEAKARADYYSPGNVVKSYGGHDRVIAYTPPDSEGRWNVTVRAVEKKGDAWVDVPKEHERTHATPPDARELKAGPVDRVATPEAQLIAEFPLKEAAASYSGISHNGSNRAKADADEFNTYIDVARDAGMAIAHTDAQKAAAEQAVTALREEYLQRYRRLMNIRAGTYSGFVAGRSGLNSKQAANRNNALDRAIDTFVNWQKANQDRVRQAVLDARTDEQKAADQAAAEKARQDKAQLKEDSDRRLMRKILSWKKGGEPVAITKTANLAGVNLGRDGYPTSIKLAPTDGSVLTDDKFDLAALFRERGMSVPASKRRVRELVDAVRAEDAAQAPAEPATAPPAETAAPAKASDSKTPILDAHVALMKRVRSGEAKADEFKASFENTESSREAITAELNTMKKDDLLRSGGYSFYHRYRDDKKAEIVEALVGRILDEYALGRSYGSSSFVMSAAGLAAHRKAQDAALRELVANTTDADIQAYAKEIAEARAESAARKEATQKAINDPQSLSDFRSAISHYMEANGETRQQAYLRLTPEQRQRYDELEADSTKTQREQAKARQRAQVATAGQLTTGQVIETKHTKHGHDLFVVQLAERVSREDYDTLNASAKRMGGSYSSYRGNGAVPGFQFRTREAADAFSKLVAGDAADAQAVAQARRDVFDDDRSQSAVQRLRTMADALSERADASLAMERKANTARRARMASNAEAAARADKALAGTMNNLADAIESGKAKYLDTVRQKVQVEFLACELRNAKDAQIRAKYQSYADQERHRGEPVDAETVDYATFPSYTAMRSDLAGIARQMLEVDGTKKLGARLMSVADDVTEAYTDWAKQNLLEVSRFGRAGELAEFRSRDDAERAIRRSGITDKAIVLPIKRGVNRVILSPSEAMKQGLWAGDGDKRITLAADFGREMVEAIGRRANGKIKLPWALESAYEKRKRLEGMGIFTASEYRAALREFAGIQEAMATPDKIREMERAMIGRRADGLDFFPTSEAVVDSMLDAAEIEPGMAVLEPSAGMGHIADAIREKTGVEPDVVELSGERRELLEAKGYHLAGNDFMAMEPREFFTYGDVFRAPDGTEGIMHGGPAWSGRASLYAVNEDGSEGRMLGWYDREDLTGVEQRGSWSGYDRIIMNPPFSKGRDIQHVMHAYELLKPGGRLVAIMGEGAFFQSNKAAESFRAWLDDLGATSERLPEDSFTDPALPVNTGVNARMVVIDKPKGDPVTAAPEEESADARYSRAGLSPSSVVVGKVPTNPISVAEAEAVWQQFLADYNGNIPLTPLIRKTQFELYGPKGNIDRIGVVKGAYHPGRGVFTLAADHLSDTADARETIRHEILGHFGLDAFKAADKEAFLQRILDSRNEPSLKSTWEYVERIYSDKSRLVQAEEVFAHIAELERSTALRIVDKLRLALTRLLRLVGLKKRGILTREELLREVEVIAKGIRQGRNLPDGNGSGSRYRRDIVAEALPLPEVGAEINGKQLEDFARALYDSQGTESAFFRHWFGDSKMRTKDGIPVPFYHRSFDPRERFSNARLGGKTGTATAQLGHFFATRDVGNVERYGPFVERFFIKMVKPKTLNMMQFEAMGDWSPERVRTYREQLQADGYDGLWIKGLNWAVAFDGKDVKAVANIGTFDDSDRVRYSLSAMKSVDANIRRGRKALAHAVTDKTSVHRAMFRNGLGWVDFVWGSEGRLKPSGKTTGAMGLSHIFEARQRKDGLSAKDTARLLDEIIETIAQGQETKRVEFGNLVKVTLQRADTEAVLTKRPSSNAWLLTGWNMRPDAGTVGNGTHTPTHDSPTPAQGTMGADLSTSGTQRDTSRSGSPHDTEGTDKNDAEMVDVNTDTRFRLTDFTPDWIGGKAPFKLEKRNIARGLRGKLSDLKPALLGVLPLSYLRDFAPKSMTALDQYLEQKRAMDADRNELHTEYDAIAQRWLKLRWTDRQAERALSDLMHAATLAGIDPSKPFGSRHNPDQRPEYDRLRAQYEALPEGHRAMFNEARDAYRGQIGLLERVIEENIRKSAEFAKRRARRDRDAAIEEARDELSGEDLDEAIETAEKRYARRVAAAENGNSAKILLLRKRFESMRVDEPYFPLKRFGDYFVALRDGNKLVSFSMFENAAAMENAAEELRKTYPGLEVKVGRQSMKQQLAGAVDPGFVSDLQELVAEQPNAQELGDQIWQLYLDTLPDYSMRKGFIHRKKVAGFSRDALRSFASSMFHSSYQIARLKHSLEMGDLVDQMEEQAKDAADPVDAMTIANEMRQRHEWVMAPKGSKIAQRITSAAFIYQLGITPAAALVNTTQTWMMGIPILGTRFGSEAKALAALTKASADFVTGRGHIENKLEGDEAKAFAEFLRMGLIDKTQAHDLAGVGETGVEYNPLRQKVMGYISWGFHNAERYNREVTAMAAYRMARESGLSHEAAIKEAADLTWTTHFDYSSGNRARYLQNDTAKVLFVFRQYSINMLSRLVIDLKDAMKGESAQVKNAARRRLAGIFSMFALFAGVMGVPGMQTILLLLNALDDDDDEWTAEDKIKRTLAETLGPDLSRVILGGVPGAALDISLTDRLGMGNLWFYSPSRELEGQDAYYYWMEQALGAAPAMIGNAFTGMKQIGEGHVWRGLETMMPKAVKDAMRSGRYASEGVQTMAGDALVDEVTMWNVLSQAMGFTPAHITEQYDRNNALKNAEQKILSERRRLLNRYAMATKAGDTESRQALQAKIADFNRRFSTVAITGRTFLLSMKARAQRDERTKGGLALDSRLGYLQGAL